MIMVVPCEQCGENAGGFSIKYPNPYVKWCKECRHQLGSTLLTYHFCSWNCLIEWVENYHGSEQGKELFPEVAETGHYPEKTKEADG